MPSTPKEFAHKLDRVGKAVAQKDSKAIAARALVTKRYILAAYAARTHQVRPNWVQYRISGDVATIRLRGGMAHLTELGSHLHPQGWDESPRTSTVRRRRAAFKKGVTLSDAKALNTPFGPKASVHHPALRSRPAWKKGVDASRVPGKKAYQKVVHETITSAMR